MKTVHITLSDGGTAEMYDKLLHGTVRAVQSIYAPLIDGPHGADILKLVESGSPELAEKMKGLSTWDTMDKANRATILGQVASWSFGEVTESVLDSIPDEDYEAIREWCDKRYSAPLVPGQLKR